MALLVFMGTMRFKAFYMNVLTLKLWLEARKRDAQIAANCKMNLKFPTNGINPVALAKHLGVVEFSIIGQQLILGIN